MKFDLTDMLCALSFALDKVEEELLGVEIGHGKRVAYLALLMGREAGFRKEELRDFVGCCLLHDNALTEFIDEEFSYRPTSGQFDAKLADLAEPQRFKLDYDHSMIGEQNIRLLPFHTDVGNIILYHHENADGSGTLGMKACETPMKAQILHLADTVDLTSQFHMETMTAAEFEALCEWVKDKQGSLFSGEAVELFLRAVPYGQIVRLQGRGPLSCLHDELVQEPVDYSDEEVRNIARLFARIIDYKSEFTKNHSRGVAEKAEKMARYYGFDPEKTIRFYFAGAMHDVGKLAVVNDILEKPGKLTANEFAEMKNHSDATRYILSQIKGISDIAKWASNHHEKLNGSGYPRGLTAAELSFEEQLMACIDIYQALREKRPYKDGLPHEKAISIMMAMADRGELNADMIRDIHCVMGAEG